MRRISMQYAQPGIELSTDVFDHYGNIIMEKGSRLTFDNISKLGQMGGGELFFEDRRVDDVPVTPLMPERLEGNAVRQLRIVIEAGKKAALYESGCTEIDTDPVEKAVHSMVGHLFPVILGEINPSGCYSLKDYDFVHPVQVAILSILIGRRLGFDHDQLTRLCIAAMLENVGYVALPEGMMSEPGPLDKISRFEVQQHCQYGYQILKDFTSLHRDIITTIIQHHERWNGEGYPFGLKGDSISVFARIISIADVYYALVSRRPQRKSYLPHEAIEFIMAFSGEYFDPDIVRVFTRIIPLYPTGVMVNLNTGERGIVSQLTGLTGRPVIRVCYDKHLNELSAPYDIDLTESQHQHRLVTDIVEY